MKLSTFIGIFTLFLCTNSLLSVVVIDELTIFDRAAKLNQMAQALRNEFPELTKTNRCKEFEQYIERGKPVHPFGEPNPEVDYAWELQREVLNLLCNFETMWTKIKDVVKRPGTTSVEYVSSLTSTLSAWEISWRSLHAEVMRGQKK